MTVYENQWIHVAMTYDGSGSSSGLNLYLNGAQQLGIGTNDAGTYVAMENSLRPVWIGAGGQGGYANGIIDEFAIWNKALILDEIDQHYNDGLIGIEITPDDNTVGLWHFDDGMGTTTIDTTENNNDGTLMPSGSYWTDGIIGGALSFDGSGIYIEVNDDDSLSFGDGSTDTPFSIEAWIEMNEATKFRIVSKDHLHSGNGLEYSFNIDALDRLAINLYDGVYSWNRIVP
jgi:hypothetical protein